PMIQNTQIVHAKPPADGALPDPAGTFNVVHTPFDTEAVNLKAGEVLVENHYLSIDPYHRFGLYDPAVTRSQFPATKPGTVISTYGVSRVLRSANPKYAVGELLYSWVRWERFTVVDELGLDAAFNYRTAASLEDALKKHCPQGIDIFFDLVGGRILDAALTQMKLGGRIPSAGMVSQYNLPHDKRYGLKNLHSILGMDITIQSYRSSSWEHLVAEMREEFEAPLSDGRMKFKTHVAEGLENLPAAFYGMFTGESFGKTVVKV